VEANQLKLLLDYTTFHIGLYSTLITGLLAFVTFFGTPSKKLFWTMVVTIACFLLAGMFGGIIGSSIPNYSSFEKFAEEDLGPAWIPLIKAKYIHLAAAEHFFFWVGLFCATVGILVTYKPK